MGDRVSASASAPSGTQPQQQGGYQPNKNTVFLLEDREGLQAPALRFLNTTFPRDKYPDAVALARVVQKIDTSRMFRDRELVIVFLDPNNPYEPQPAHVQGQARVALKPLFRLSPVIKVADVYLESADGGGAVQVRNLINENTGRVQPGLCELISRACMVDDEYGQRVPTVRAIYRDDDYSLRVTCS